MFEKLRAHRGKWPEGEDGGKVSKTASTKTGRSKEGDPSLARRVRSIEKAQEKLGKQIKDLLNEIKKPLTVTVSRK